MEEIYELIREQENLINEIEEILKELTIKNRDEIIDDLLDEEE